MARVTMTNKDTAPPAYEATNGRRVVTALATEEARTQLPRVSPSAAFLLQVHPSRWDVYDGRVMPVPSRFVLRPGVNGIDVDRRGRLIVSGAIANRRDRGWTVIPADWYEDEEGVGYVQALPVKGGVAHITVFDSLYPGSTKIRCDVSAMADWFARLIDEGKIAPPSVPALEDLVDRLERELAKLINLKNRDVKFAAQADASAQRLDVARRALEAKQKQAKPVKRGKRVAVKAGEG